MSIVAKKLGHHHPLRVPPKRTQLGIFRLDPRGPDSMETTVMDLVVLSVATNTLSSESKTGSGKKFLHRRVTNTGWKYLAPRVREELAMRQ